MCSTMKKSKFIIFGILIIGVMVWYLQGDGATATRDSRILPNTKYKGMENINHRNQPSNTKIETSNISPIEHQDSLADIKAAREALEEWRLAQELLIHKEREQLNKEWQKLKQEQERLEDEKEEMIAAIQLNVYKKQSADLQEQQEAEQNQKYLDSLAPADPKQFEGLNSTQVHEKYPGITFLPEYRLRPFVDPTETLMIGMVKPPKVIEDMDDIQAEERFYELVTRVHIDCNKIVRQGSRQDGGWDICMAHPYSPRESCLVYSIGINNDFTFDDAMANRYGCSVRSFDPSMTIGDHKHTDKVWFYQLGLGPSNTVNTLGWKLETLGSILAKCGHLTATIDVLKIDIDYNEWDCLETLYKEGVLHNVKQLVLEIHTPEVYIINRPSTREDFYSMYNKLLHLEDQGFRRFSVHYNPHGQYLSQRSGKHRTCCFEISYINIHYLKS